MGIIDILTYFNYAKGFEYLSKALVNCNSQASCVPPGKYKNRFYKFIEKSFKGED